MRTNGYNRMGRCPNTRRRCNNPGGIRCNIQQVTYLADNQGGKLHGLSPFVFLSALYLKKLLHAIAIRTKLTPIMKTLRESIEIKIFTNSKQSKDRYMIQNIRQVEKLYFTPPALLPYWSCA